MNTAETPQELLFFTGQSVSLRVSKLVGQDVPVPLTVQYGVPEVVALS